MHYKPTEMQVRAIAAILAQFNVVNSTLLVLATGLGKTLIASEVAHIWEHGRVMFIAHSRELIVQAAKKIREVTGEMPAIEQGDQFSNESDWGRSQFVVASKDSLHPKRLQRFRDFGLLIIDEAHRAAKKNMSYTRIHETLREKNPHLKMLGLTATPKRADKSAMGQVFESIAFQYEIEPAIDDGWLVPVRPAIVQIDSLDLSSVPTVAGDLAGKELQAVLEEEENVQGMAYSAIRECEARKRVLVFTKSVQQAKDFAAVLNRHQPGTARWLSGNKRECPDHVRAQTIAEFSEGNFKYLVNCALFLEGFDEPRIDAVVMARPTKSVGLFVQMLGRGTRPLPNLIYGLPDAPSRKGAIGSSEKPDVLVLDYVDNSRKHKLASTIDALGGRWDDETRERIKEVIEGETKQGRTITIDEAAQEAAKRKLEAERAAEAEKQRKRAAFALKANYQVKTPDLFNRSDVAQGQQERRKVVMPFGKHKGEEIGALSTNYIKTFLENVVQTRNSAWVFKSMERELNRRGVDVPIPRATAKAPNAAAAPATEQQRRVLEKFGKPCDVSQHDAAKMIEQINRELAARRNKAS